MSIEIREYFIIVSNIDPQKAWIPYDPISHYTYDLDRLPKRAKFGSEQQAAARIPDCHTETKRRLEALMATFPTASDAATESLRVMEFKVAKVAITVDLLPQ